MRRGICERTTCDGTMTPPAKPRERSGYSREETEQVISVCLTVAVTLGALMDDLCVVGGLVPSLLIDQRIGPDPVTGDAHPGTNDLDVGLAVGLLNDEQYAEISHRLRQEGSARIRMTTATRHRSAGNWLVTALLSTFCCRPSRAPSVEAASTSLKATSEPSSLLG